ncbi:6588_t:CDS:1 [Gigaspora margarita]|uniref:6588_t:CDS:1 n=1 Tax=Gigaspora margarita TaxID=4874 RepID=A0ABN7WBF1_GIGMA|nr:6588_t:CDS:1 [Gigaspora margarita]
MEFIIRAGGQTGVDKGTLDAALDHEETMRNFNPKKAMQNITITGWCPKKRRSEDGPIDKKYPLKETNTNEYNQRTEMNVKDAEATLILLLNNNKDYISTKVNCVTLWTFRIFDLFFANFA